MIFRFWLNALGIVLPNVFFPINVSYWVQRQSKMFVITSILQKINLAHKNKVSIALWHSVGIDNLRQEFVKDKYFCLCAHIFINTY